jgi:hypothetical protein
MATTHKVTFFPVGNGDTVRIHLDNGRTILCDYNQVPGAEKDDTPHANIKKLLKDELDATKRDYMDVVAFTHADRDHIQGSTEFFYLEQAEKYQGAGRIKIRELWVPAAMVIESATNDQQSEEFVILRQEARHRLLKGEGIKVFSNPPALREWLEPALDKQGDGKHSRDHLILDAGKTVPTFKIEVDKVEFFIHSPYKEHHNGQDFVRNQAALVFNIRFDCDGHRYDFLQCGDARWEDLEDIVRITRYHGNDDRLKWDLYNLPHHCSYLSLNDEKGETETVPKPRVKELLLEGQKGSYIVSSSDPIRDDKDGREQVQPPHIQARKAYERYNEEVDGGGFLVTMSEPNGYNPKPMNFEFTSGGVAYIKDTKTAGSAIASAFVPRAGRNAR